MLAISAVVWIACIPKNNVPTDVVDEVSLDGVLRGSDLDGAEVAVLVLSTGGGNDVPLQEFNVRLHSVFYQGRTRCIVGRC